MALMRALLLLVALSASAHVNAQSSAPPDRWRVVRSSDDVTTYVDTQSARSLGNGIVRVWFKRVYSRTRGEGSRRYDEHMSLENQDCTNYRYSTVHSVYRLRGASVDSFDPDENDWHDVLPDSVGETELEAACALF